MDGGLALPVSLKYLKIPCLNVRIVEINWTAGMVFPHLSPDPRQVEARTAPPCISW